MPLRYIAFLRGMNLGRRRLRNVELCACFVDLGFGEVSAFLASGNVLFSAAEADAEAVRGRVENGLAQALGYPVPTFLRAAVEVREIAAREPFDERLTRGRGKPQVAVLHDKPTAAAAKEVVALGGDEDHLVILGRELHWLPRAGLLDSTLDFVAIERLLGPVTVRTKRTIDRLALKLPM